jgi:flagellin
MNAINSNLQNLSTRNLASAQDLLVRSLNQLTSSTAPADASVDPLLDSTDLSSQGSGLQSAAAEVQTALSSVQTADGYLGGMTGLLANMKQVASRAQADASDPADLAQDQREFAALQDQLRAAIGGSTSEIGGASGVGSPVGSFNGSDLFGPSQSNTPNPANLRQGAMLDLISQDSEGNYTLNASSSNAATTVAGALQQVSDGRTALSGAQSQLGLAAARLQVEQQNLLSAFSPINDADAAQQSNLFAAGGMLAQPAAALLAQNSQSPAAVLSLVQG